MSQQSNRGRASTASPEREAGRPESLVRPGLANPWWRLYRWWCVFVGAMLWIGLVYSWPLRNLRETRQLARTELTQLLQTNKPDPAAILDAFDRATEQILFSASGPYFILAITMFFLIANLVIVKRRLNVAERDLQVLRDVILGVDEIPLR